MVKVANRRFGSLFKSYRLRSEIDSLMELGLLLHDEGVIYERSILTHWQNGTRTPTSRNIVLGIARLFIKRGGIKSIAEVNELLASLNMPPINLHDLDQEPAIKWLGAPFNVPIDIVNFTGREDTVMNIVWMLNKGFPRLINGPAGAGKTTLAIRIAHETRNYYTDGTLWYAHNIRGAEGIFLDIADTFGLDFSKAVNLEKKAKIVRDLLSKRKILLILDDIQSEADLKYFFPGGRPICSILMTSRLVNIAGIDNLNVTTLSGYTEEEYAQYSTKKLGLDYYKAHEKQLAILGQKVAYSPLLLTVLFSQISKDRRELSAVLETIEGKELNINYGRDILRQSLDYSLKQLPQQVKDVFLSMGIFCGPDFSIRAVAEMHKLPLEVVAKACNFLDQRSLVEKSKPGRYRLHPLVRIYLREQEKPRIWYSRLADYYVQFIGNKELGNQYDYDAVENELENITAIYEFCYKNKETQKLLNMWKFLGPFFWETSRWSDLKRFGWIKSTTTNKANIVIKFTILLFVIFFVLGLYTQYNMYLVSMRLLFVYSYFLLALFGSVAGFFTSYKWGGLLTNIGRSLLMFSLGLSFQVLGQILYAFNLMINGYYVYPSYGDIGYFGSAIFYLVAMILLNKATSNKNNSYPKKIRLLIFMLTTVIIFITIYVFYIDFEFSNNYYKNILDLGYPTIETISLFTAITALINSKNIPINIVRSRLRFFIGALLFQLCSDYLFLLYTKYGEVTVDNFFDLLYLLSYFLMTLAILQFRTFYSGEETKKLPAVS